MRSFELTDTSADALCGRLGVEQPRHPRDVPALYRAWTATIPFDTIAKNAALAEGCVPPGDDPEAFVAQFLDQGLGGTCWGHCATLAALLSAGGIPCRIGLERMQRDDVPLDLHAFVAYEDEDSETAILDLVHASGSPLALQPGARGDHGVIETGIDDDDGRRWWHWYAHPNNPGTRYRYALLSMALDRDDVRAFCELSARVSGIPDRMLVFRRSPMGTTTSARWTRPGPDNDLSAPALVVRRWTARPGAAANSIERHEQVHTDLDEGFTALGYGPDVRALAEKAGLLDPTGDR